MEEKQRVTVSRSFMSERDVIILDEPASMIDPVAEFNQFQNISQHFKGRTIILISHRVGFARLADLIFYMENGKIEEVGTHSELMKQDGKYVYFFNQQAQWYERNGN